MPSLGVTNSTQGLVRFPRKPSILPWLLDIQYKYVCVCLSASIHITSDSPPKEPMHTNYVHNFALANLNLKCLTHCAFDITRFGVTIK